MGTNGNKWEQQVMTGVKTEIPFCLIFCYGKRSQNQFSDQESANKIIFYGFESKNCLRKKVFDPLRDMEGLQTEYRGLPHGVYVGQIGGKTGEYGAVVGQIGAFWGIADNQQVSRWLPKGYRMVTERLLIWT